MVVGKPGNWPDRTVCIGCRFDVEDRAPVKIDVRRRAHAPGRLDGRIEADPKDTAGNKELLRRQPALFSPHKFGECVMDRETQLISEVGAGSDSDNMPASFKETPQLGNRLPGSKPAQVTPELRRDAVGVGFTTPAETLLSAGIDSRNGAADKDDDVIFCPETARIDVPCVNDLVGEMILFHDPPDPAGRHGTAIG